MKVWIISDLHLEYAPLKVPLEPPDADVCIVAGDLCRGIDNGIRWLARQVAPSMQCVYVAGNHEYYRGSIKENLEAGRAVAKEVAGVHFLENDAVVIGGVRFLGATLWTDFGIEGKPESAMDHARLRMNDYRKIAWQKMPWRRLLPFHTFRMHQDTRRFLQGYIPSISVDTVVVTHHLPHEKSIPERFKGELLNAAYASDLTDVLEAVAPRLWVHGHVHDSCDYVIGRTRVISNPRGYDDENSAFVNAKVVSLA